MLAQNNNTISITEAKSRLSSLVNWTNDNGEAITIQSRGNPKALIIPYIYANEVEKIIKERQRSKAINNLHKIASEVSRDNKDLSEKQVQKLANKFTKEVISDMVNEGKITFED